MANETILIGVISSFDTETGLVRVTLPDMDGVVSPPLSLLTNGAGWGLSNPLPEVGDNVICVFPRGSLKDGVCLGTMFDGSYSLPGNPETEKGVYFEDGSHVYYDKTDGSLNLRAVGDLNIDAENVIIEAQTVTITAPIVNFNSTNVIFSNNITVLGEVKDQL